MQFSDRFNYFQGTFPTFLCGHFISTTLLSSFSGLGSPVFTLSMLFIFLHAAISAILEHVVEHAF